MAKKKKVEADGSGFGGTFADLLKAQGLVAPDAEPSAAPPPEPETAATIADLGPIRLQFEKKGRGGKKVTVVTGLAPLGDALQPLLKQLKKTLGAGATVEGDTVVVQGDQRARLTDWLRSQGARDVR